MFAEYKRDVSHKVRPNTWEEKEYIILTKILPYLGKRKINELKVTDIKMSHAGTGWNMALLL